jgi:uncharacterized membrane protein YkvI
MDKIVEEVWQKNPDQVINIVIAVLVILFSIIGANTLVGVLATTGGLYNVFLAYTTYKKEHE